MLVSEMHIPRLLLNPLPKMPIIASFNGVFGKHGYTALTNN